MYLYLYGISLSQKKNTSKERLHPASVIQSTNMQLNFKFSLSSFHIAEVIAQEFMILFFRMLVSLEVVFISVQQLIHLVRGIQKSLRSRGSIIP